jgi:hypothetical protein
LVAEDGSLWVRQRGIPRAGRNTRDFRYAITMPESGPPGIAWFERSLNPETVAELDAKEAQRRKSAERQAAELQKQREALRKNPPRRTLTLGDADRSLGKATLRELALRFERAGGVLVVEGDGGLTFRVQVVTDEVMRVAPVLARASETILALKKRRPGTIDPSTLPDARCRYAGQRSASRSSASTRRS